MRTRAQSPSRSRPFRVNVLLDDGLLRQSLALVERRSPLVFRFSLSPLGPAETDAYLVEVGNLRRLLLAAEDLEPARLILACGPPRSIRSAFLAGCVDYLREPWEAEELEVRLLRLMGVQERRRFDGETGFELEGRSIRLPDGRAVVLSSHEAVVAGLLFANCGELVSRRALSLALWGRMPSRSSRAVDMHVSALRRKIGRDVISCVRGQGYLVDLSRPWAVDGETRRRVDEPGEQW